MTFQYLLKKLENATFQNEPFRHLEIEDFLSPEHFQAIVRAPQIDLVRSKSTEELLDVIELNGYSAIAFPGCLESRNDYLKWLRSPQKTAYHEATEGFGIVYRLMEYRNDLLAELDRFFRSEELKSLLIAKFGIDEQVTVDAGIQKYLHGYEISPHPDIRRKALTWMLNINPGENTEQAEYHTHYMRLRPRWSFIGEFWRNNPEVDRDWLPWEWCQTVKRQRKNNSIVLFSPSNDTFHAVKASYDHLKTQRTQFYGNLWYEHKNPWKLEFKHFDFTRHLTRGKKPVPRPV